MQPLPRAQEGTGPITGTWGVLRPEPWAQQRKQGRKEHSPERKQPLEGGQRESKPFQAWAGNAHLDLGAAPRCATAMQIPGPQLISRLTFT